ncbi:uncharacterized protein LOC136081740 [Hydra vulgaris]|uniref:Uncharacterized protein LOC136081740 n=1 Tax=Hydra vulgaris TaxID=6087 RepID=A0ABM4C2E2_HYDVU
MNVKTATTYSRFKLSLLYKNVKICVDDILKEELPKTTGFAFSTDLWQSRNNDAYQTSTLRYVSEDFRLKMFAIGVFPFYGQHTVEAIAIRLDKNVSELAGNNGVLSVVCVHDSPANMKAAINKRNFVDLFCVLITF